MKRVFVGLVMLLAMNAIAQKNVKIVTPQYYNPSTLVVQRVVLNANNISSDFQNTGIFDQNTTSGNLAGMEWPKGFNKFAVFTAGLCIGCGINGQYAQVMASYKGEYVPGRILSGGLYTDTTFKLYSIKIEDSAASNPDYANWYKMVPYGAPFVDVNHNGIYDDGIDIPGIKDAAQTVFEAMTDADPNWRSAGEGFGGGVSSPLLDAEIAWTAWAYTTAGLQDVQFYRWRIINKGINNWDSTFIAIVSDPDLGDPDDDYIGCDTTLNMGFCYNATNNDGNGNGNTYGANPPAVGMEYLLSSVVKKSGMLNDTLGLNSFNYFNGTGTSSIPCITDPNGEPVRAYHFMQGMKKDRTPHMDVSHSPPKRTKFCYYGDPETQSGWTELKGSMKNCGGDTVATIVAPNSPFDRRFVMGSGRLDFRVLPNDTQTIVISQMIARGTSNTNSVTRLKELGRNVKTFFDSIYKTLKVEIPVVIPDSYYLFQNYPNPFNPRTSIKYQLKYAGYVVLRVYDIMGREVVKLVNENMIPGTYESTFDGSNFSSGVYFYTLQTEKFTQTKRMVLLK